MAASSRLQYDDIQASHFDVDEQQVISHRQLLSLVIRLLLHDEYAAVARQCSVAAGTRSQLDDAHAVYTPDIDGIVHDDGGRLE